MEDVRIYFRPPLAPTLYLCIPKGDTQLFEQNRGLTELENLRSFVVQGELLTYYVVVSFESARKDGTSEGSLQRTKSILEQLRSVFCRLRIVTKFKSGKDIVVPTGHSRVVGHTKVANPKNNVSSNKIVFGIGNETAVLKSQEVQTIIEPERPTSPSSNDGGLPLDSSRVGIDDDKSDDNEEGSEMLALSQQEMFQKRYKPIQSLDPNTCTTLPNGDLLYKFTTKINLADKYIGTQLGMSVEATMRDFPSMDINSLLNQLVVPREIVPPSVSAFALFTLVDPIKVSFSTASIHMDTFITVTLENLFHESVEIGDVSLHFAITEVSKRPSVDMDKLFRSTILDHEPLPIQLQPQEVFSFVIKVETCPLGSPEEVSNLRRHVLPCLLLTWKPADVPTYLISQFSVPFPTPQAEQLLVSFKIPEVVAINSPFFIHVAITNLSSYPRNLAIEFPSPKFASLPDYIPLPSKNHIINNAITNISNISSLTDPVPSVPSNLQAMQASASTTAVPYAHASHMTSLPPLPTSFSTSSLPKPASVSGSSLFSFTVNVSSNQNANSNTPPVSSPANSFHGNLSASSSHPPASTTPPTTSSIPGIPSSMAAAMKLMRQPSNLSISFGSNETNTISSVPLTPEEALAKKYLLSKNDANPLICIEKVVHMGRAEPKGELNAMILCVASQVGIMHLEGIQVYDKHNRDDVRVYQIEQPIEILVSSALPTYADDFQAIVSPRSRIVNAQDQLSLPLQDGANARWQNQISSIPEDADVLKLE